MDALEHLEAVSDLAFTCLGNPDGEFFLHRSGTAMPDETKADLHARRFYVCGLFGYSRARGVAVEAESHDRLTLQVLANAGPTFGVLVARYAQEPERASTDGVEWLSKLWDLKDPREN